MTAAARILQADVERVVKGAKAGGARRVKFVLDATDVVSILVDLDDAPDSAGDEPKSEWNDVLEEARKTKPA